MKTIMLLAALITITGLQAQIKKKPITKKTVGKSKPQAPLPLSQPEPVRQSITEKRLNGDAGKTQTTPFVSGIYAAPKAGKTFDSAANRTAITGASTNNQMITGRDTILNRNTLNEGGIPTNSGAVDKSGQSQFGQSNWQNNTVGESQWTVPPPVSATFNKQFGEMNNAVWSRNMGDTNMYRVRYQQNNVWIANTFTSAGQVMDTRTEIPLAQAPLGVTAYKARQPGTFEIITVNKYQPQGRPFVYELRLKDGRTIYVNEAGTEIRQ